MKIFNGIEGKSMLDPTILKTQGFKLIQEDFFSEIKKDPDYVCNIFHICEYKEKCFEVRYFSI